MAEGPENILKLLQEMRAEMQEMRRENAARFAEIHVEFDEIRAQIGTLAQGQNSVRIEMRLIREQMHEIAITVDHHSTRLDGIEHHLGLNAAKH